MFHLSIAYKGFSIKKWGVTFIFREDKKDKSPRILQKANYN
jgi:hypothetical protein